MTTPGKNQKERECQSGSDDPLTGLIQASKAEDEEKRFFKGKAIRVRAGDDTHFTQLAAGAAGPLHTLARGADRVSA